MLFMRLVRVSTLNETTGNPRSRTAINPGCKLPRLPSLENGLQNLDQRIFLLE